MKFPNNTNVPQFKNRNLLNKIKSGTTSTMEDCMICGGVVAVAVVVGLGASIFAPNTQDSAKVAITQRMEQKTPQQPDKTTQNEEKNTGLKDFEDNSSKKGKTNVRTDLSLGGIDVGITVDEMHKALGKEKSSKPDDKLHGYYHYTYDGLNVGVKDGQITTLVSNGPQVKTKKGIHEGSSLADVLKAYGSQYNKESYDGLVLYEYTITATDGEKGILRFAINPDKDNVDYISARLPEKTAVALQSQNK